MMRTLIVTIGLILPSAPAAAQELDAETVAIDSRPAAVTVYRGRAAVSRRASIDLAPGAYDLVFANLPHAVRADTIQAQVRGAASVLSVEYAERTLADEPAGPIADLDRRIDEALRAIDHLAQDEGLLVAQEKFLDGLVARAGRDAGDRAGTAELDVGAARAQLAFIAEERGRIVRERRDVDDRKRSLDEALHVLESERAALGDRSGTERTARVLVAVTGSGRLEVDLVYLVEHAFWQPTYRVRAATGQSAVAVEYDALLAQRTGEDWADVEMTLSTAQPTVAANPPVLEPYFLDVLPDVAAGLAAPAAEMMGKARTPPPGSGGGATFDSPTDPAEADRIALLEAMSAGAATSGEGPSVTFALPRTVTVATDARQHQRTRIATIEATAEFVHVAQPLLTEAVYVRGELTNASPYQLLPGPAAIFVGQDYVGPTTLPGVAPSGTFDLHFGIDPAVTTKRTLVQRSTSKTGLLGGGRRTSYDYRIEIDNGAGKLIALELWDRRPVSRSDQIQVEVVDLARALSTDAEYVESQLPQGLMRWDLSVPAGANGPNALAITYGLRVTRSKDLRTTPLPED
jgi:uncharacterized protein (TIGR02231 family)